LKAKNEKEIFQPKGKTFKKDKKSLVVKKKGCTFAAAFKTKEF